VKIIKLVTFFLLTQFIANSSLAHGMDNVGPNGGNITMPGAFHVELVVKNKKTLVYLLDIAFKNPIVENSSVEISVNDASSSTCNVEKNYFVCPDYNYKKGDKIVVQSTRKGIKGTKATYQFPLKF
jgi:hypothetical protein